VQGVNITNYKGTNSIVLLGVVDHDYCFRYIDVGSYGRNADGGVFQCSNLYPLLENDSLLPEGGVLVGDDAFPLKAPAGLFGGGGNWHACKTKIFVLLALPATGGSVANWLLQ
jgi:hypothetical protein